MLSLPVDRGMFKFKELFTKFYQIITVVCRNLGLAIGKRLIESVPPTTRLTIVVTSRTFPNVKYAIEELKKYVFQNNLHENRPALIEFDYLTFDLADITSVQAALREMEIRYPRIDYLFFNACLALYNGIDWNQALVDTIKSPYKAFTYGAFKKQKKCAISNDGMGNVFQANVFTPWFMIRKMVTSPRDVSMNKLDNPSYKSQPLLGKKSKVFWVSSVTADLVGTNEIKADLIDDIELLNSKESYEASKREIDLLHHATAKLLKEEYGVLSYLVQPGIFKSTTFSPTLNVFTYFGMLLAFYFCRLIGSKYHTIDPWIAAYAFVKLATDPEDDQLNLYQKYGSATNWKGDEYLLKEDVIGYSTPASYHDYGDNDGVANQQADKIYRYVEMLYQQWNKKLENQVKERYLY